MNNGYDQGLQQYEMEMARMQEMEWLKANK